ncbi:MAG: DJ-1/PfpI family protein [Deltaproteobacteria bacterium]|nr:DJ-1/PfpI family protein [Deltaproteobacteria bacterium]
MSAAGTGKPHVLVPIAPGVEEIEAVTIIDVLRRAGAEVTVAGLVDGVIEASRGVKLVADVSLDAVVEVAFDAVVLPGGLGGTNHLRADPRIRAILERSRRAGSLIGAVCAAPTVLWDAGLLAGKRATSHPSVLDSLTGAHPSEERVVVDDGIVTSRGAGTSMEFALALARLLVGDAKERELRTAMVV